MGGSGGDVIRGGNGNERIDGGAGNDVIAGDDGRNVLIAGAGNDLVQSDSPDDAIDSGEDDDLVLVRSGDPQLSCGPGTDVVRYVPSLGEPIVDDTCETEQQLPYAQRAQLAVIAVAVNRGRLVGGEAAVGAATPLSIGFNRATGGRGRDVFVVGSHRGQSIMRFAPRPDRPGSYSYLRGPIDGTVTVNDLLRSTAAPGPI